MYSAAANPPNLSGDYANQVVLKRAREVDPEGTGTLGIITKPDDLPASSEAEAVFIDLAKNKNIFSRLGWHCVRNRGFPEKDFSFAERNQLELAFFSKGRWVELDEDTLGIDSLRTRLSTLLFQHVKQELPRLREDLNDKYEQTCSSLDRLGLKREDEREQRDYLIKISLQFNDLTKAAVNGHYEGSFFGHVNKNSPLKSAHARRLRAMIQHYNMEFAQQMRMYGHKYRFNGQVPMDDDEQLNVKELSASQKPLSGEKALEWVRDFLRRTRGVELYGNLNSLVVGELFWELSESWSDLAQAHTEEMAELRKNFVEEVLKEICTPDIFSRLGPLCIEQALRERFEGAEAERRKIIDDNRRYPATWNHY